MFIRSCLLGLLGLVCVKNLPFVWHFPILTERQQLRFFYALSRRLSKQKTDGHAAAAAHRLLLPAVMTTRSPPTECDFNMHKSNSTYFTDLDMSRAHLAGLLFSAMFMGTTQHGRCNLLVGAVACVFQREIKPQQTYELWTRVASWDDKWLYMVTHFVVPSSRRQGRSVACSSSQASGTEGADKGVGESPHDKPHKKNHQVLASAVTRMVFKKGRLTVTPAQAIAACHATALLDAQGDTRDCGPRDTQFASTTVSDEASCGCHESTRLDLEALESLRKANLPIVQLHRGWDAVHALFDDTRDNVLARHQDLIF